MCSSYSGAEKLQVPNDIVEGKRIYRLELELDLGDPSTDLELFDFLMLEGGASTALAVSGIAVSLQFVSQPSEGSYSFNITCSPQVPSVTSPGGVILSAKHNIPAPPAGLVPVTVSMDIDSVALTLG